ncbi:MAG TPA: ChaN family lipoprotein [Gemmatimonadales bacterium]|nr:ChaN family lipoprotein [Gemmatimonadales bacterium]
MLAIALLAQIAVADTVATVEPPSQAIEITWTPHRVFDARRNRWSDLEGMAAELARADVVFFGEFHDDPGTHAMQRVLLEALARRRPVILSMEMFERDVQPLVDAYLAGMITEDSLLATARPWPNYASDYRPAVEWARFHGWPVIAANVPRPIASAVARGGIASLDTLGDRRALAAERFECGSGEYFDRFAETMRAHLPGDSDSAKSAALERYYQSQCIKDETMAESIVRARGSDTSNAVIVHLNGSFHSNYGLGTVERVKRRLRNLTVAVISAQPVEDLDHVEPERDDRKLGDWLIYTLKP